MKYCAIDIETTGLNPETCQILQVAAVYDDLNVQAPIAELPRIELYVTFSTYTGEAYALAMNAGILKKIADKNIDLDKTVHPEGLLYKINSWLCKLGVPEEPFIYSGTPPTAIRPIKINVAGKNFANFDNLFFRKIKGYGEAIAFHHRILDVSSLYFDPKLDTKCLPSTEECMKRAKIPGPVAHTALEDAINVVELIRAKFPLR